MNFTKLRDRIDTLPLVLAGPLVRRVEPAGVTIWVALRRRRHVRLEIYDGDPPQGQLVASGAGDTVTVGANLHIVCVTAKPGSSFTDGTTYQYNLFFDHLGGSDDIQNGADLFGPRIISASAEQSVAEDETRNRLTYTSDGGPSRPSFILPPTTLDEIRLLHGSCRKVSGPHHDALEAADHILRDAFKNSTRRPHMLFLTGDNIYNDGCERASFEMIVDSAPVLLGWDESIVSTDTGFITKFSELSGARWQHTLDMAGLSNPGADYRQLFGLGECIALYLLTFAEVLWPPDLDYQLHTFDFRGSLPAVRRALANVATYMIFDDHEFSNTWNLTAEWVESVLNRSLGRRIYQNSLAAYALCQGWGNTPDQFETGAGKALFDAIVAWSEEEISGTRSPAAPLAEISRRTGLPDVNAFKGAHDWSGFHGPDVVRWYYSVPCPSLNIDVLDTFMWRSYEDSTANPIIVSDAGLDEQIHAAPADKECSLVVVSNVGITLPGGVGHFNEWGWLFARTFSLSPLLLLLPVPLWLFVIFLIIPIIMVLGLALSLTVGLPSLFSLIRAWLYYAEHGSSYEHQTKGFESMISHVVHRTAQQLTGGKRQARAVLLSGDAHKTFCMRMEYWSRVPFSVTGDPVEAVVAQFVSSPCKWVNPTKYDLKDKDIHHWAGWTNKPALTWVNEPDESPWRFKKSPWMTSYVPGSSQPRMNPDPEWRYSLEPVRQAPSFNQEPLEIPDRASPTLEDQLAEMENVVPETVWDIQANHVLKVNNLAEVTFNWTPGSRVVTQQVWWRGRPTVDPNWTISRFDVSMEPPVSPPQLPQ